MPESQVERVGGRSRKLRLIDRFWFASLGVYGRCKGYRFAVARTPDDVEAANLFVMHVFEESGFYESEDQPEPPDETDCTSTFFIAWKKDEIAGTIELVQSDCEFPVEQFFNFEFPKHLNRKSVAELTRFTVAPNHRGRNPVVAIGLLCTVLRFSIKNELRWWTGCTQSLLLAGFGKLFRDWRVLPELPPGPVQQRLRKGRDGFFHPSRGLRVFLVDSWSISISSAAWNLMKRRLRARKRSRKSGSRNTPAK